MSEYRIAVIGGDGVGPEVVAAGMSVLDTAAAGFSLAWEHLPWGSDYYQAHGVMMPADGLDVLERFDAIYLGAVGRPDVPDHVTLWGLLLPIRQRFDLYLNVRPVRLLPGVLSPLRDRGPADIDMIVVRENSEGEYAGVGGRAHTGHPAEVGIQVDVFTRAGVERVARYAFELARSRRGTAGQHHQVEREPAPLRDVGRDRRGGAPRLPGRQLDRILVDAAAASWSAQPGPVRRGRGVEPVRRHPHRHRRGDPGRHRAWRPAPTSGPTGPSPACSSRCTGRRRTSPGQGMANPIGAVWAGAMMLDHLGEKAASSAIMQAVEEVLAETRGQDARPRRHRDDERGRPGTAARAPRGRRIRGRLTGLRCPWGCARRRPPTRRAHPSSGGTGRRKPSQRWRSIRHRRP